MTEFLRFDNALRACTKCAPLFACNKVDPREGDATVLPRPIVSGKKAHVIAKAHERSRGAIVSRIEHLGLRPSIPDDLIYDANE